MDRKKALLLLLILWSCSVLAQFPIEPGYGHIEATLLNQDPDPAEQGEYLELRWKIVKIGNAEIQNLRFNLELDYPFYFDESDTPVKSVGDWIGYSDDQEYYTLHYKVRVDEEALEDTYEVKLKWYYSDGSIGREEEYDVRVGDKEDPNLVVGTLQSDPTKLVADTEEAQLDVEIENIGDEDAQNVKISIGLPAGFTPSYTYSDRDNLGTIAADDSETATFYIDIDENMRSGNYKSNLTIQYKEADDEDNEYKELIIPLEIPVHDMPLFEIVSFQTNPAKLKPGDGAELKVTVKNVGGKKGESVSLRAFKESSQPFDFDEKSDFIGKLEPGETGEALLKFTVDEDASPKKYIIDLEVRSISDSEVLTEEESGIIVIANGEKNQGLSTTGIIIIVVIVAIGLGIYFMRKKIL